MAANFSGGDGLNRRHKTNQNSCYNQNNWHKKRCVSWEPTACWWHYMMISVHELHARYVKLRAVHAQGMTETFSPPPRVCDPTMHHGTCVTHVPWCMPGTVTSGFVWNRWRGKRSRHSRHMRKPQFYVSGKRPMERLSACFVPFFILIRAPHNM